MALVATLATAIQTLPVTFATSIRVRLQAGAYTPAHSHAFWEIVYHAQGAGVTTVNGRHACEFLPGSVVIYPPHQPHDQRMRTAGEDCCVLVDLPVTLPNDAPCCWIIPRITDPLLCKELAVLSDQSPSATPLGRKAQDARATAIMADLLQTVTPLEPSPAHHDMEEAARYLQREYHRPLRMAEVAQHIGMSESYLRHRFHDHYGISPIQWLLTVRIDRAKDLLRNTPYPLKSIARVCGFDNERYFCKVFRKAVGCTPGGYRGKG